MNASAGAALTLLNSLTPAPRYRHRSATLNYMRHVSRRILISATLIAIVISSIFLYPRIKDHQYHLETSYTLKNLGLALQNYESAYKRFPPPSMTGHSWRIRILPYLASSSIYENYDFTLPWDSWQNMLIDRRLLHDSKRPFEDHVGGMPVKFGTELDFPQQTRFLMVVGEHCFGTDANGRKADEIADGLSNTIALVETSRPDIHWLHPIDLNYDQMSFRLNDGPASIGNIDGKWPMVCFCDGAVYNISPEIPESALKALLTIDGQESLEREDCVARGWLRPAE